MNEHKDELEHHIVKNLERFLERMDKDEDLIKIKKDQIKLILYNNKVSYIRTNKRRRYRNIIKLKAHFMIFFIFLNNITKCNIWNETFIGYYLSSHR